MRRKAGLSVLTVFLLLLGVGLFLSGCSQETKEAELKITDEDFVIRQDTNHSFVVDASGTIQNVGPNDVKNVVVTGYCRSCGEVLINGKWFISDVEKTPEQKDTISYLAVGDEEDFAFKGVAFFMDQSGNKPQELPEEMEIVVESYDVVE
ncbi:MAG: hypothetical protein ACQERN_11810 [Thermodesulfobacteriota bacterium]